MVKKRGIGRGGGTTISFAEWLGGIRKLLDDLNESGLVTTAAHECPGVKEKVQAIRKSIREIKDILEQNEKHQRGGK